MSYIFWVYCRGVCAFLSYNSIENQKSRRWNNGIKEENMDTNTEWEPSNEWDTRISLPLLQMAYSSCDANAKENETEQQSQENRTSFYVQRYKM